jgi:hypothetical protein
MDIQEKNQLQREIIAALKDIELPGDVYIVIINSNDGLSINVQDYIYNSTNNI